MYTVPAVGLSSENWYRTLISVKFQDIKIRGILILNCQSCMHTVINTLWIFGHKYFASFFFSCHLMLAFKYLVIFIHTSLVIFDYLMFSSSIVRSLTSFTVFSVTLFKPPLSIAAPLAMHMYYVSLLLGKAFYSQTASWHTAKANPLVMVSWKKSADTFMR